MTGHWHFNSDEYCEGCLPVVSSDPRVSFDDGEQDTPAHCCVCHKPLEYRLTTAGVRYVLEAIRQSAVKPSAERNKVHDCYKGTYYEGKRHVEIVRDWAEKLLDSADLMEDEYSWAKDFLAVTKQ
jgi:hypothetical protein